MRAAVSGVFESAHTGVYSIGNRAKPNAQVCVHLRDNVKSSML